MCLQAVTKRHDPPLKSGTGWKVFTKGTRGGYTFEVVGGSVRRGAWLRRANNSVMGANDHEYQRGFHVFATKEGAVSWQDGDEDTVVVRVRLRSIRTEGTQNTCSGLVPAVIADGLFVTKRRPR